MSSRINNNNNRRQYNIVSSSPLDDEPNEVDIEMGQRQQQQQQQQQSSSNRTSRHRVGGRRNNRGGSSAAAGGGGAYSRISVAAPDDDNNDVDVVDHDENSTNRTSLAAAAAVAPPTTTTEGSETSSSSRKLQQPPAAPSLVASESDLSSSSTTTSKDDDNDEDKNNNITITVLDFAQSKFTISSVNPSWTIARFKQVSSEIHKVPVHLQRLIFHGKMLADTKTLEESGVKEEGTIIHLFPKPRVVITNNNNNENETCNTDDNNNDNDGDDDPETGGGGGARVPTIILDSEEAERRSQILVLGSPEYIEAQNNVKLFSFMLLVISSIELLNLLAIALGVPQQDNTTNNNNNNNGGFPLYETDDDVFSNNNDDDDAYGNYDNNNNSSSYSNSSSWGGDNFQPNILYQPWGWANTFDLLLSIAGVYVALIGIQASNENTLRLAKIYLMGTFVVGIGWLLFNFYITVTIDRAVEEEHREHHPNDDMIPDMSDSDIVNSAVSVMVLPGMVWLMCCMRAFQFQRLLSDAEEEAESRIQAELERSQPPPPPPASDNSDGEDHNDNNDDDEEELVLQNNSAILA